VAELVLDLVSQLDVSRQVLVRDQDAAHGASLLRHQRVLAAIPAKSAKVTAWGSMLWILKYFRKKFTTKIKHKPKSALGFGLGPWAGLFGLLNKSPSLQYKHPVLKSLCQKYKARPYTPDKPVVQTLSPQTRPCQARKSPRPQYKARAQPSPTFFTPC
jgi:hypothetical protein